jgi:tetratricopeptide (TPR) repeat protein
VVLGGIHTSYDFDWAAADKELQQALALAPNDATATFLATRLAMDVGRWDEALTQLNAVLAHQAFQWLERAYAQKESDPAVHQRRLAAQESRG